MNPSIIVALSVSVVILAFIGNSQARMKLTRPFMPQLKQKCQSHECPVKGQIFNNCGSACPPNCTNPTPICTRQCVPRCQCPPGQVINEATNECVPVNECPPKMTCSIEGQVFEECGTACPRSCANATSVRRCTRQCVSGCRCPPGELIDEAANKCVPPNQCPCSIKGQVYTKCSVGAAACRATCKKPHPICPRRLCVPGCQCPRGTVLDEASNKCVKRCKCSTRRNPKGRRNRRRHRRHQRAGSEK